MIIFSKQNKPPIKRIFFLPALVIMICVFLTGCGKNLLYSCWKDREIVIDGKNDEWQDVKVYFRDKKVAIGVFNDNNFLYLQLVSWDKDVASMIKNTGFVVWFDDYASRKKNRGIRFPLGNGESLNELSRSMRQERHDKFAKSEKYSLEEIEWVSADKNEDFIGSLEFFKQKGIDVQIDDSTGNMIYELKIPLVKDSKHIYTVSDNAKQRLSICFEIAPRQSVDLTKRGKNKNKLNSTFDIPDGGWGSSDDSPEGGGHDFPGVSRGKREWLNVSQGIQLWVDVELALTENI